MIYTCITGCFDPKYGENSAKAVLSNVHRAKAGSVVAKAPRKDLRKNHVSKMKYTNPSEHRSIGRLTSHQK